MNNRRPLPSVVISLTLVCSLLALDAAAWGPRSSEAISRASLQIVRRTYPDALRAENQRYDSDFVKGAVAGPEALRGSVPLNNDVQAVAAVGGQIQLLRETRKYGMGSHFAYRLGVLAALTADLYLPLSFAQEGRSPDIYEQLVEDVEARFNRYNYRPNAQQTLTFVYSPQEYFAKRRQFTDGTARIVYDDYRAGLGYEGIMSQAAETYFGRAIESVADVLYTVLRPESASSDRNPSPRAVARYFIEEIEYLLNERQNFEQAEKAYVLYESVGQTSPADYARIGDLFYAFGTKDAQERGVREWKKAQRQPGPHRERVANRISEHYLRVGEEHFERAMGPQSKETDLNNALAAFRSALEYDRTNSEAAERINRTNEELMAKRERYELALSIIASTETVMQEADRYRMDRNHNQALAAYDQALTFLTNSIDTEFPDLAETAKKRTAEVRNSIREILDDIMVAADEAIAQGDEASDARRYDEALNNYRRVRGLLEDVPDDAPDQYLAQKREKLADVELKIQSAQRAKQNAEAEQQAAPGPGSLKKKGVL